MSSPFVFIVQAAFVNDGIFNDEDGIFGPFLENERAEECVVELSARENVHSARIVVVDKDKLQDYAGIEKPNNA